MTTDQLLDQIAHTLADPEVGPDAARTHADPAPRGVQVDVEGCIAPIALGETVEATAVIIAEATGSGAIGVTHLPGGLDMWFSVLPGQIPNLTALGLLEQIGSNAPIPYGTAVLTACLDGDSLGLPESTITTLCALSL